MNSSRCSHRANLARGADIRSVAARYHAAGLGDVSGPMLLKRLSLLRHVRLRAPYVDCIASMNHSRRRTTSVVIVSCLLASTAFAQTATVAGAVRDETGGALPGVTVELRSGTGSPQLSVTDAAGTFRFEHVAAGHYQTVFTLINFASRRRELDVTASGAVRLDAVLHLSMSADVTVSGKRTFTNLADVENPAENLVGIAQSASQGAITADQLAGRPMIRPADVLETVPGVIVSAHASGGKAPQYFLRGFNLDHGTEAAQKI